MSKIQTFLEEDEKNSKGQDIKVIFDKVEGVDNTASSKTNEVVKQVYSELINIELFEKVKDNTDINRNNRNRVLDLKEIKK